MHLNRTILSSIGAAAAALTLTVALAAPAGASTGDPESAGPVAQGTAQPAIVIEGESPLQQWINGWIHPGTPGELPCVHCMHPDFKIAETGAPS